MNVNQTSMEPGQLVLPDPSTIEPPEDLFDLLDEYVESTSSQLEELEHVALAYEQGDDQEEHAATIRRVLHKIKGESGMVGFLLVERTLHEAENAFEILSPDHRTDMLLRLRDWLAEILEHLIQSMN